jgi:hypothetical protein
MDLNDQINIEHILFLERKCRICGEVKSLMDDFYLIRKGKGAFPSAYSYECKDCTKKRILNNRKNKTSINQWQYPDW